jgi:predicted PurR-regulated permease PerM
LLGIDAKAARYTWTAAVVLLLLGALYLIRTTLLIFVIALLFAYLLYPLMDLIERHLTAKTRTPALAITFVLVLGILAVFGLSIGSAVADQATNLTKQAPAFLDRIRQNPAPGPEGVKTFKSEVSGFIEGQLREHYDDITQALPRLGLRILSASTNLIDLIIIPILSFLILRDGRRIRDGFLEMLDSGQEAARSTLADIHRLLLVYMRSLLLLCCATFVAFGVTLSAMGVPYALLLASVAFPLEFIPVVGPLMSSAIIIAVSVISGYSHVSWVVIFLGIYRLFEDYFLSPHLMSRGVELHPLMIIFGVFAGGQIGGVAGIFLSVPLLALARLLYHHLKKTRTRHLQAMPQ